MIFLFIDVLSKVNPGNNQLTRVKTIFRTIFDVMRVWFMGIFVVGNRTVLKRFKRTFSQGTVRVTRRRKYYKEDPGPGRGAAPPEALQVL